MMNQQQEQPLMNKYDPEVLNRLKREIVQDLEARREWQEDYYGYDMNYGRNRRYPDNRYAYPPSRPMYRNRRPMEIDYDWWTDREDYDYQRNQAMIRSQLRNELVALDKMNRRIGQVSDPQVRQVLGELLQEARQQGVGVPELIESLNTNNPGFTNNLVNSVTGPFRGIDRRSFGWGIAAGLLGLMVLPAVAKSVRSLTEKAMDGSMDLSEKAQGMFEMAKEEFEDIVAEAKFNNLKGKAGGDDITDKGQPPTKK